jgi:vacuolar-type H+-ATPase subunit D/Vma8
MIKSLESIYIHYKRKIEYLKKMNWILKKKNQILKKEMMKMESTVETLISYAKDITK